MLTYTGNAKRASSVPAVSPTVGLGIVRLPAAPLVAMAVRDPRLAFALYSLTSRADWESKAARRIIEREAWRYVTGVGKGPASANAHEDAA